MLGKENGNVPLGGRGCLECGDELLYVRSRLGESLVFFCDATAGVEHGRVVAATHKLANFDE